MQASGVGVGGRLWGSKDIAWERERVCVCVRARAHACAHTQGGSLIQLYSLARKHWGPACLTHQDRVTDVCHAQIHIYFKETGVSSVYTSIF